MPTTCPLSSDSCFSRVVLTPSSRLSPTGIALNNVFLECLTLSSAIYALTYQTRIYIKISKLFFPVLKNMVVSIFNIMCTFKCRLRVFECEEIVWENMWVFIPTKRIHITVIMVTHIWEYTKNHWNVYFKWVDRMVYALYLNKLL